MRKYEIMYILDATLSEDDRKAMIDKLHGIISADNGKITDINEWGVREFAYPIKHLTQGYYLVLNVETEPEAIKEFTRIFKIESGCIRHLVINLE